jgi:simple sugar transport system substrate-binding protein
MNKKTSWVFSIFMVLALLITACTPSTPPIATAVPVAPTKAATATVTALPTTQPLTFGLVMVGPYNDQGWSQATYEAGQYAVAHLPGTKMVYVDNVNSAGHPGTTAQQLAEGLLNQGAKVVIFNSDDFKDDAANFAKAHPGIKTIYLSGDTVWKEGNDYQSLPNMTNIMGKMEYMKAIAGCAAALTTQTGQIGYLGPLINDETRRLSSSVYLGAEYCWTNFLKKDPAALKFKVTWIGYWFNIPGTTLDPTQVANDFFNSGYDVVLSGIDTTEALDAAAKMAAAGKKVWAIPYDYKDACAKSPDVCLGVPYFNWGPAYVTALKSVMGGTFQSQFLWNGPDWSNINNPDTGAVGFNKGTALSADAAKNVDAYIAALAGGLDPWTGPINLQDGTAYLKAGEKATDQQIWYLPQLLQGMDGQSVSK